MWVMRIAIFVVGGMATYMALTIPTIYGLWALCSDLVYVILFPQLLCVVHFPEWCNTYGSLFSYCLGLTIRLILLYIDKKYSFKYYNKSFQVLWR